MAPPELAQRPAWSELLAHPMRTFHTVRHLQPRQMAYQMLRRVAPISQVIPAAHAGGELLQRTSVPPAPHACDAFDGRTFSFLNRRRIFEGNDRWHPSGADDLWVFNLHYFKFLCAAAVDDAQRVIADWIDANRDQRSAAWHPYPISLRVREWVEWLQANPAAPPALRRSMTTSIAAQMQSLSARLEFNLLGNHLLENAITLCWAGLSFSGPRAGAWLRSGETLFDREVHSQVLADGSHEERSPMYQAQLAESLLRLAEVAARSTTPGVGARIASIARSAGMRMLAALDPLVHPDGQYALMNDTAFGVAPTLDALLARFDVAAATRGGGAWDLPSAGFSGWRGDDRYLVMDTGAIGPDHQPGHGHAGALSFELSSHGRRVVTDTGVLTYAAGLARQHDRSTAAHNTIEIDGRDQSEVWGAFRCGRRSSIVDAGIDKGRDGCLVHGAYRGPGTRGPRSVSHAREVFINGGMFAFTDRVTASGAHRATLRLHLAPGLHVHRHGRLCHIVDARRRPVAALAADGFDWIESSSPYHPEFGREIARTCVSADLAFRERAVAKWWLILN